MAEDLNFFNANQIADGWQSSSVSGLSNILKQTLEVSQRSMFDQYSVAFQPSLLNLKLLLM